MFTSLPKIPTNSRDSLTKPVQPASRSESVKLPPWDQPAQIKFEPLEPPSPYQPVVQKRAYPSALTGFSRLAAQKDNEVVKATKPRNSVQDESSEEEMTFEEQEARQSLIIKMESEARDDILFAEQHEWTRLWLDFLHDVSVFVEEDIQLAEIVVRDACEREEERERMSYSIEMESTAQCIKKRMQENIRRKTAQIMPLYKEGRDIIIKEEAEGVESLLEWFRKNRPFGMRLPAFLSGAQQQRFFPKKPNGQYSSNNSSLRKKKLKTYGVSSVISNDAEMWPEKFPEPSYQEEGRLAWRESKLLRYTQRKDFLFTHEVEEKEEKDREDILAEEAKEWLPIITLEVDDYHEARRQTQDREKAEATAEDARIEELQKREAIFDRLEAVASLEKSTKEKREEETKEEKEEEKREDAAIEKDKKHFEATSCTGNDEAEIKKEKAMLELLRRRIDVLLDLGDIDEIKNESEALEVLRKREKSLHKLDEAANNEDDDNDEDDDDDDAIKEESLSLWALRRRLEVLDELEDIAIMKEELGKIWRPEEYETSSLNEHDICALIEREKALLLLLQKREHLLHQLEDISAIKSEASVLHVLRKRESMLLQLDDDNNNKNNNEIPSMLSADKKGNNGCVETSSSLGSDSVATPLHPMLNMVMSVALERDPFLALRNPAFSALGEAECELAACEGKHPGSAARALAFARHIPFCLAYLVHTIWRPSKSQEDVKCTKDSADDDSGSAVQQLLRFEEEGRERLIKEQIVAIWTLYQEAAKDASDVSKTEYGKVYYIGVNMGNEV